MSWFNDNVISRTASQYKGQNVMSSACTVFVGNFLVLHCLAGSVLSR
jgi:hypothetical protein